MIAVNYFNGVNFIEWPMKVRFGEIFIIRLRMFWQLHPLKTKIV